MDIYKCPILIWQKKFIKFVKFVKFVKTIYFGNLKNLIHGPISFLSAFNSFLYRPYLSYFVLFCPIFSEHFLDFYRFSRIFINFSKFFQVFLMQSSAFFKYFRHRVWCEVAQVPHKKNNGFFRIFFCKDSFLNMRIGHL